ncbi:hypothetical protein M9Y10_032399 [Tritrichomonas musculus]|uniref:MULE transposase domain-containing protein n=1 Tax=Tritrichomonas musculus TaxID=1915356 RepID=A0ABR2GYC6_9EUKA
MDIWNPEFLSKLEMDSNKELFDHLSIEALKSGFKLCSRYGFLEPYGKFYCSKGRISKKSTNKCGCPFSISTIVKRYPDGKIKYGIKIDNSLNLNHVGHTPNPRLYMHVFLSDDAKVQIKNLHQSGIKPNQIQKYLLKNGFNTISTLQIQSIIESEKISAFNSETTELSLYIEKSGGMNHILEIPSEKGNARVAILTIHKSEIENLAKYGETIFIDGTYAYLKSRWEIFPITAIDTNMNLCCCGIMYAATSNEQILNWLLHALNEHEEFKKRTETIVTDEDHAFRSAYNTWIKEINSGPEHYIFNHIFCALHKSRNFQNKLNKSGLNKSEKLLATQYFKLICYHPNKNLVKSIMEKLKTDFGPRISHYIEKHVESEVVKYRRCLILHHRLHASPPSSGTPSLGPQLPAKYLLKNLS